jgi:hypothetical protein
MPVFFMAIKSVLLTARCGFPLYEHVVVSDEEAKFKSPGILNIDQSKPTLTPLKTWEPSCPSQGTA